MPNSYPNLRHPEAMNTNRMRAIAALAAAGLAWGISVPLSKVALAWLAPGWLTFARFGPAAAVLLLATPRPALRAAFTAPALASGALGYGGCILLQNAGIARTSVTHAALLIGAVPVLVAIIAAVWQRAVARPIAWTGFVLSLAGVGLVTGGHCAGTTRTGDALVLASVLLSATVTVAQGRLLANRDPVAVTAAQFAGAAVVALPFAAGTEGMPAAPAGIGSVLAVAGLIAGGTLLPFTLFAYGQRRVTADVAGAFLNLEPLVGAVAGIIFFGDPAGPRQLAGGAAIITGIALSGLPLLRGRQAKPPRGAQMPRREQSVSGSAGIEPA
jgi:O-acetylserine/cysteine efflux transporter